MNRSSCKTTCLLALAIVGCATPGGSRWAHRANPQGPAEQGRPLAATSGYDQHSDEMQFQLAEARWRRNESQPCQQALEEVVARNPSHRGAHLRLAELYLLKNQPNRCCRLMRSYCRTHRQDAEAHHLLGLAYESVGHGDQALASYDVAASLDPEDPIVRHSLQYAVAAREAPRTVPPAWPDTGAPPEEDEDRSLAELPPPPDPPSMPSSANDEPERQDRQSIAEARQRGPRIHRVPAEIPTRDRRTSEETEDEPPADDLHDAPRASLPPLADWQLPKLGGGGDSPVRWAYELEVGHVKPAQPAKAREHPRPGPATRKRRPRLRIANIATVASTSQTQERNSSRSTCGRTCAARSLGG